MDTEEPRVPRIGEPRIRIKPDFFLKQAYEFYEDNQLSKALQYFVAYFENLDDPRDSPESVQHVFTKLVTRLVTIFEEIDEIDRVFTVYLRAINFFPENSFILNLFGIYLFRNGELNLAKIYLESAVKYKHLPAEKNLLHVMWHILPRWHFRMLNDQKRNSGYYAAITKAVQAGYKTVYDIGSGCGLLSLIAANSADDVTVTAFEENDLLGKMSQQIFNENNADNITLHIRNSTSLIEPPENGPPCNLIVSEIFDVALIGERALESLYHAITIFANAENFKIIPSCAELYVTGIKCDRLTAKFHYIRQLDELNLKDICIKVVEPEPYEADQINLKDTIFKTDTKKVFHIDFYNRPQLEELIDNGDCLQPIELKCIKEGEVQALVVWFDLHLDETTTITTNPNSDCVECWEQGIFYLDHPIYLKQNEILKVKPIIVDSKLIFNVLESPSDCNKCFEVSKEMVSFLNDTKLIKAVTQSVKSFKKFDVQILDLNCFPLFGLLMAKCGATVYHVYKDLTDLKLIEFIAQINNIKNVQLIFLDSLNCYAHVKYLRQLDIICPDFIHVDGSWNLISLCTEMMDILQPVILPKKLMLAMILINSDYLEFCNVVDDNNLFNFKISKFINYYTGSEHPALENFPYTTLSKRKKINITDMSETNFQQEFTVNKAGILNGILFWFEFQFTDDPTTAFSTLDSTYYSRSCSILKKKQVQPGDKLLVHVQREDNYMKVYCD